MYTFTICTISLSPLLVNYELAQVNPESGVPLSCLPAYFEAYDAYAQRVDHEVDHEDFEVDEVDHAESQKAKTFRIARFLSQKLSG